VGKGFFKASQVQSKKIKRNGSTLAQCKKCGFDQNSKNPKIEPKGNHNVRILHVAGFPEAQDDKNEDFFSSRNGQYYRKVLKNLGHDIEEATRTGALLCRPSNPKKIPNTITNACYPNLKKTIQKYKPHIIIPVGDTALKALINHKFKKDIESVNKWRGFIIPDREFNAWVCPVFNPSYVRNDKTPEVAKKIFRDDLKCSLQMRDVSLPAFEDETKYIRIIKHAKDAVSYLRDLLKQKNILTAFDYEGTGLKPQRKKQRITSCSISTGPYEAVAFPMFDDQKFLSLFKRYLSSKDIYKICANIKYEKDWSNVKLNAALNGLFFDTMIGMHFIDNRKGITGLDFQNYVSLGIEPYNTHIDKFLKTAESGNDLNNIDEIDIYDLLIYNGMDSMTEFRQGLIMMDIIGIDYSHLFSECTGYDICPQYKKVREE